MINGVHLLLNSRDPAADRAFFRDVLNFPAVDAGEGWLIFALPPAEFGIHPGEDNAVHRFADRELSVSPVYLLCDDLPSTIADLRARSVKTTEIVDAGWGIVTTLALPGGGSLGLYQPRHPTALDSARS